MSPPIVFFDGVCNLCNGFVDFLIRHDRDHVLRFASLQGETAQALLGPDAGQILNSVIFRDESGKIFRESDAALHIFSLLGMPWKAVRILFIVPKPFRDGIYRWVAKNRYRWFGKKETCRLPSPEERQLFLD